MLQYSTGHNRALAKDSTFLALQEGELFIFMHSRIQHIYQIVFAQIAS